MRSFMTGLATLAVVCTGVAGFAESTGAAAGEVADLSVRIQPGTDDAGDPQLTWKVGSTHQEFAEVTNAGPSRATGVTLTIKLSAGQKFMEVVGEGSKRCTGDLAKTTWTCSMGHPDVDGVVGIDPGFSSRVTYQITYSSAGLKTITATAKGVETDPSVDDNSASLQESAQPAGSDMSVSLQDPIASGGGAAPYVGETRTQVAQYTNLGPDPAAGTAVTITASAGQSLASTDTRCARNSGATVLTCSVGAVAVRTSGSVAYSITYVTTGAKTVTATIHTTSTDPVSANNTSKLTATVVNSADLRITSYVDIDANAGTKVGDTHRQSVTFENRGPITSDGVKLTITATGQKIIPVSAGCTVNTGYNAGTILTCTAGNMPRFASKSFEYRVTFTTAGSKNDVAKLTASTPDPSTANNTRTITSSVRPRAADLAIDDAYDYTGGGAVVGTSHELDIFVSNYGPDAAPNAKITLTASAGQQLSTTYPDCTVNSAKTVMTCTRSLDNQGGAFVHVFASYTTGGAKTVTVTIDGPDADPATGNNKQLISTPAAGPAAA